MIHGNYYPYTFISIYQAGMNANRSSIVVTPEEAEKLRAFLSGTDGLTATELTEDGAIIASNPRRKRFEVDCSVEQLRRHLRDWARAWREQNDSHPPIDLITVRGKESADLEDIAGKKVAAHLQSGGTVTGEVVGFLPDFESSGRLCIAWIMVSADRALDRYLTFGEVREFEVLD